MSVLNRAWRSVALTAVLAAAVVLGGLGQPPADQASVAVGTVTSVYDGDTFTVDWISGAETIPGGRADVRPYLIDAPERGSECYWEPARSYARQLLKGQTVWVYHWGRTSGDRVLGFVYLDPERQSWLGAMLVSQGFAPLHEDAAEFAATQIPNGQGRAFLSLLEDMEDNARGDDRGLWRECR
ncbi:MAG: thermonuclease family protein [Salinibacter sp.]